MDENRERARHKVKKPYTLSTSLFCKHHGRDTKEKRLRKEETLTKSLSHTVYLTILDHKWTQDLESWLCRVCCLIKLDLSTLGLYTSSMVLKHTD